MTGWVADSEPGHGFAPPSAPLSTGSAVPGGGTVNLAGLDDSVSPHVQDLIRAAAANTDQWGDILDELFGDLLLPDGVCDPATAPALRFVTRLAGSSSIPAPRRLELAMWLLYAADRRADSLIASAGHGVPVAAPWTEDAYAAIGDALPGVLAGWPDESPAIRYALAGLAALHPEHGALLADEIATFAAECGDTQQGAYLRIAAALVSKDDELALELADAVLSWDEDLAPDWLTAPNVSAATRAAHLLAEGMQHTTR